MMGGFGGCCGGGWFGGANSFGLIGFVVNLLILVAILIGVTLLIVWMIRSLRGQVLGAAPNMMNESVRRTPKEVLEIRYARGDLTQEEYQAMIADLR